MILLCARACKVKNKLIILTVYAWHWKHVQPWPFGKARLQIISIGQSCIISHLKPYSVAWWPEDSNFLSAHFFNLMEHWGRQETLFSYFVPVSLVHELRHQFEAAYFEKRFWVCNFVQPCHLGFQNVFNFLRPCHINGTKSYTSVCMICFSKKISPPTKQ